MLLIEKEIEKKEDINKRIEFLDIAKGIGIILMIIGHTPNINEHFKCLIYAFHMPMFFIISGYFFKYRENKENNIRILKKLIVPYIITCIILIVYKIFRVILDSNFYKIPEILKEYIIASIYGAGSKIRYGITNIGAIWFLLALGFATFFINYIYKKKYRYLYVILIAYIGYITSKDLYLPFSIQPGMIASLFVYIGVLIKENGLLNKKIPKEIYALLFFIMIAYTIRCDRLTMVSCHYPNGLFDIIAAVSGSILCIQFCKLIERFSKLTKKFLSFVGRNSLLCLCVHFISSTCFEWRTANRILVNIGLQSEVIRSGIIELAWSIIITTILIFMYKLVKKYIKNYNKTSKV